MTEYIRSEVNSLGALNAELEKIETALDSKVSTEASGPRVMHADLDMNSNDILNLPAPSTPTSPVRVQDIPDLVEQATGANYVGTTPPEAAFKGMRWYDPSVPTTYVYDTTNGVGSWIEEPVQSLDGDLRTELNDVNSMVPVGKQLAKDIPSLKDTQDYSFLRKSNLSALVRNALGTASGDKLLRKVNANRFEVFTPFVQRGRFLRWRFDNDETQFVDASPSDTAQGYTRPYLMTTVTDTFLESSAEVLASTATTNVAPTTSGNYLYLANIGDYFQFTTRASRLRLTYQQANNAGKFKITIDGSATLVNKIAKDGSGNAVIDSYNASTSSVSVLIADNLPDKDIVVRFEITDKNASSSAYRMYLSNLAGFGALRVYNPYNGTGTTLESAGETLKLGSSAVEYAIAFRPNANTGASSPFIGSVHGYENRTELGVYIDDEALTLSSLADGTIRQARNTIVLAQKSEIFHPADLVGATANVTASWTFGNEGASYGHKWKFIKDVYISNGYSSMWTVYGANSGGAGGALMGWVDRVIFGGYGEYPLVNGDSAEVGHHLANEVLFYGTPTSGSRNADSGKTACLFTLTDPSKSFNQFEGPYAETDAVWVQDRATFRKLYVQSLRGVGTKAAGSTINGGYSVSFVKSNSLSYALDGL